MGGHRRVECAVEILCLVAASDTPDASGSKTLAAAAALQAASGSSAAAHARFLLEGVVPGGNALVVGLTMRDGGRGAGCGAVDSCALGATDGRVGARSSIEVLVELPTKALLAH